MNSKIVHKRFIQKHRKSEIIEQIVKAIAARSWFGNQLSNRTWLRDYLSNLYDHGLVLQDELGLCGIAAAKHRFRCRRRW